MGIGGRGGMGGYGTTIARILCLAMVLGNITCGFAKGTDLKPDLKGFPKGMDLEHLTEHLTAKERAELSNQIAKRLIKQNITLSAGSKFAEVVADPKLYPACPPHPFENSTKKSFSLQEWVVAGIKAAPFTDAPFKRSLFWCNVFPPKVFRELDHYWPPTELMHQDIKSGQNKKASHKHANERFKTSLEDLVQIDHKELEKVYPSYSKAKQVWHKVSVVLYSKAFEEALWEKMGLKKQWMFRDFRIQTDREGFAIGVHPDISKKIVTMMFYLPSGSPDQRKKQALEYGTCLHTKEQYAKRSTEDGAAPCATKFPFISNAGYSFTVGRASFHSASAGNYGLRRTIMLNWYNTVWKN